MMQSRTFRASIRVLWPVAVAVSNFKRLVNLFKVRHQILECCKRLSPVLAEFDAMEARGDILMRQAQMPLQRLRLNAAALKVTRLVRQRFLKKELEL